MNACTSHCASASRSEEDARDDDDAAAAAAAAAADDDSRGDHARRETNARVGTSDESTRARSPWMSSRSTARGGERWWRRDRVDANVVRIGERERDGS